MAAELLRTLPKSKGSQGGQQ